MKLLAEPWDCGGLYQVGSFPNWDVWGEWNGRFRDDVRCSFHTHGKSQRFLCKHATRGEQESHQQALKPTAWSSRPQLPLASLLLSRQRCCLLSSVQLADTLSLQALHQRGCRL